MKLKITLTDDSSFYENSIMRHEPICVEDWHGLVSKQKKRTRRQLSVKVHILRNGTDDALQIFPSVSNTCAFDAVTQSLALSYIDRPKSKKHVFQKKKLLLKSRGFFSYARGKNSS